MSERERVDTISSEVGARDGRGPDKQKPLNGVRILDLTRLLPGGFLGALLADLGAEVIKIEEPLLGDHMRWEELKIGPESAASWIVSRGKRSFAVNLKDSAGVDVFLKLVETADIVIEGFRPGVVDRLGVGYSAARERNPRIVYASLTGYGGDGPMAEQAGHDINYISYAGVLAMTGPLDGPVCQPGVQVGDLGGASILGIGLLAALYDAARSGTGSQVEVAMYDAALAWTSIHAGEYWASGVVPDPGKTILNGRWPCYQVYRCSDGRFISVGAVEEKFWTNFCTRVDRPDLIERQQDPSAIADVAALIAGRTRDEWTALLEDADACVAPVLDLGEALAHPMARARGMVADGQIEDGSAETAPTLGTPIRFDGTVTPISTPPPGLGADTRVLASEIGLAPQEIDQLINAGAIGTNDKGRASTRQKDGAQ